MSRVAIVSPHLDDAILSAWLLLKRAEPVRVISCFAGVPAHGARGKWDARTGPGGSAVGIRRNEDLAALGLVNAEAIHLGCIDEQYRGQDEPPIHTLTGMLREKLADVDEVWIPAALGRHADHLAAREAAMAACARTARRFLFADLPYAGQPAWSAEITGAPRDIAVQVLFRALRRPDSRECLARHSRRGSGVVSRRRLRRAPDPSAVRTEVGGSQQVRLAAGCAEARAESPAASPSRLRL